MKCIPLFEFPNKHMTKQNLTSAVKLEELNFKLRVVGT